MTTTISKNGFVIASIVSNSRNNKTIKQYGKSHEWGITNQITLSNGITIGPEGLETSDMTMNMPSRTTVFIDSGHGSSFINSGFPFGRGKVTCIDSFHGATFINCGKPAARSSEPTTRIHSYPLPKSFKIATASAITSSPSPSPSTAAVVATAMKDEKKRQRTEETAERNMQSNDDYVDLTRGEPKEKKQKGSMMGSD